MAPCEALYGHKCKTLLCWTNLGEKKVLVPDLGQETENNVKIICNRSRAASNRQKSYSELKWRDIEFSVSPWKKVLRFFRKGKLSPRFIGPYHIVKRVGPVAYQLELPLELDHIHDIFHESKLRCYRSDHSHVIPVEEIEVRL
ncbi:DNA/RNA polymerases superfamily protein [Gossypium australe]|uniref:DNA/RNA polymerases superfamily protein n=1 Tax=Gossypium australe TaxID=47621 RepID=A0A5B6VLZ8_9ROSI|nr:DNA/RNA polymerases superfamily protein [Gossypium australe]